MIFAKFALLTLIGAVAAVPVLKRDTIPAFVLAYAPIVYLDKAETYYPGPIADLLLYTTPSVTGGPDPLTLGNLDQLNPLGGRNVSLNSKDDFTKFPPWLNGVKPDSTGKTPGGSSAAIIVNDYKNGTVYAYYMYYYPFNLGNYVWALGRHAGNHIGEWEHTAIKFVNGVPESVWFSQHASGQAFTYAATEKSGLRPVGYSASGSHATYAQPGKHEHTISGFNLPFPLLLTDDTSKGTLWDPALNAFQVAYDGATNRFTAYDGVSPTAWLNYLGVWGDKQLPSSDSRQEEFLGVDATALWTGAPTGPYDKQLNRPWICAASVCPVYTRLMARAEEN